MKVVVTGASGFLGSAICKDLLDKGHEVLGISRNAAEQDASLSPKMTWSTLAEADINGHDAVVHLAGEPLFPGRWTAEKKERIVQSRVEGTRDLVAILSACSVPPKVLISASGVGYYGQRVDDRVDESAKPGRDFLAQICVDWEAAASKAEELGVRVVQMRLGVVLGAKGGALKRMIPIFRWGVGGPIGSGKQPFPWIDCRDVVDFVAAALEREDIKGPVNLVAGSPTQKEFAQELGRVLKRPAFLPAPGFSLKILFGEGAASLLGGQNVESSRLEEWALLPRVNDLNQALSASVS